MSILLLPVSRVTSAFFIERIASVNSACDFSPVYWDASASLFLL